MAGHGWVQHISGQGEKWEVHSEKGPFWYVLTQFLTQGNAALPKSEYRLCPPPELWVDVTEECEVNECEIYGWNNITHNGEETYLASYRRRKVQLFEQVSEFGDSTSWGRSTVKPRYAFIIEKKVTA